MAGEALREIFAIFGVKFETKELDRGNITVTKAITNIRGLRDAIGGSTTVRSLARFVENTRKIGDELDKSSRKLGLTTRELQELRYAAELGGVSNSTLANSMTELQKKAHQASRGNAKAARLFRRLGVDIRDANGELRRGPDLLDEVARGLSNTENPIQRAARANQIFGNSGRDLLPLLDSLADGSSDLRGEFVALGGGASQEMIEQSAELSDSLTRFRLTVLGLRSKIAVVFLPIVNKVVEVFAKANAWFLRVSENSHIVELALATLGIAATVMAVKFAAAWIAALWPIALAAAAIAVVLLFIDDLIVTFQGGNSVIQGFIDELFGIGTTAEIIASLIEAWEGFKLAMSDTWDVLKGIIDSIAQIPDLWGDLGQLADIGILFNGGNNEERVDTEQFLANQNYRLRRRYREQDQEEAQSQSSRRFASERRRNNRQRSSRQNQSTTRDRDRSRENRERRTRSRSQRSEQQTRTTAAQPATARTTTSRATQNTTNVDARSNLTMNVTAHGVDAAELERRMRRVANEMRDQSDRERRHTLASLEAAPPAEAAA